MKRIIAGSAISLAITVGMDVHQALAYYTTASTDISVGSGAIDIGGTNIGQTTSQAQDTETGMLNSPQGAVTETGTGYAYSNLATGMIGAKSATSTSPSPVCCVAGPTSLSTAIIEDVLTFTNPAASASTQTTITATFTIDGGSTQTFQTGSAPLTFTAGLGGDIGTGPVDYTNISIVPIMGGPDSILSNQQPDFAANTPFDQTYTVTSSFVGAVGQGELFFSISTLANLQNASTDFSETGIVDLIVPQGVTYTSESGVFLTQQSVPEPASLVLLAGGVIGVFSFRRRNGFQAMLGRQ